MAETTNRDDERERKTQEIARGLTMRQIQVEPWYLDVRGEIVKPDQVQVTTKYFWSRWVPKLGPLATCLLLRLRQYCYFNRATGEKRDWCYPSQDTLAQELGLQNRKTVMDALRRLQELGFVRREAQYRLDPKTRRPHRTTDKYFILMEDPIAPEDEPQAFVLAAERLLADSPRTAAAMRSEPASIAAAPYTSEKRTYSHEAVDNPPYVSEKRTHDAVRKTDRKSDLEELLNNVNVNGASRTEEDEGRIQDLTQQMVEQLGDPKSRNFFRRVAERVPEHLIYMALSETKDAKRTGQVKKTPGAYFTHVIKKAAEQVGVRLLK